MRFSISNAVTNGVVGHLCYTHRHCWRPLPKLVSQGMCSAECRGHHEVVMYQILESRTNPFQGVEVSPDALPEDPHEFRLRLADSLRAWSSEGLLAVWLRVPIDRSALIPVAVEVGLVPLVQLRKVVIQHQAEQEMQVNQFRAL